jgi:NADH-quinone oxidoreductase subunit M
MGGFNSPLIPRWLAALATFGLVLGAGYFLWTLQRMFFGNFWIRQMDEPLHDLSLREKIMLYPLAMMALVFGVFPNLIFDVTHQSLSELLKLF